MARNKSEKVEAGHHRPKGFELTDYQRAALAQAFRRMLWPEHEFITERDGKKSK